MSRVVLFGTGRGAAVAHRFLAGDTNHEVVAFTVDAAQQSDKTHRGLPVVAFEEVERLYPPDDYRMLILLGYQQMNGLRRRKFEAAKAKGYTLESYVASNIFRVEPIRVGENCFILDNQSISLDVEIGNNVVMWSSNHIGDMTTIADHAWLTSHVTIAASARIEESSFIGIGATIANHVRIGRGAFIGADVLQTSDAEPDAVYLAGQGKIDIASGPFMRAMIGGKKL